MSSYKITIFIAPPEVAKVTGRYICLLRGEDDIMNCYLAEDSLVDLAKALNKDDLDWPYIEKDLLDKGIFTI